MYKDIHCSIASNENELVLQLKDLWRKWFLKIIYKNLTMYNGILCRYFQKKNGKGMNCKDIAQYIICETSMFQDH